jgi:hypothetical protein
MRDPSYIRASSFCAAGRDSPNVRIRPHAPVAVPSVPLFPQASWSEGSRNDATKPESLKLDKLRAKQESVGWRPIIPRPESMSYPGASSLRGV